MSKTKKLLPAWNRRIKKTLIDRNMTVKELAVLIGYSSVYTSNVINGTIVGASKIEAKINEVLGLNQCAKDGEINERK